MAMRSDVRWKPPVELSPLEEGMCARLARTGRLFRFLRLHRHELLNEEFQRQLSEMYAEDYAPGRPPVPPARLVMVTLLQAYTHASDAEAVHRACFDRRWQMVLDCIGCEGPDGSGKAPFSAGLLVEFRSRLIRAGLDRELVRQTVELAKVRKDFSFKTLKVAIDSAPIWGAGRVEDTFNLLAHGLNVAVVCAAELHDLSVSEVLTLANVKVVGTASSIKAALDIDWDDPVAKKGALERILQDVSQFREWASRIPENTDPDKEHERTAMRRTLATLQRLVDQDIEPDPEGGGSRIIDGTSPDRQISIADPEMRHGRKSRSKTINGYKGHVAIDMEQRVVLDAIAVPANQKESEGALRLRPSIEEYGPVRELHVDRGYLPSPWIMELYAADVPIISKPYNPSNRGLFPKEAFTIDLAKGEVTCPGKTTATIPDVADKSGARQVQFEHCSTCTIKAACTKNSRGRTISIHPNEELFQELRLLKGTPEGRARLRERVAVEHSLAHVVAHTTHRARYVTERKVTMSVRIAAALVNLQECDRAVVV